MPSERLVDRSLRKVFNLKTRLTNREVYNKLYADGQDLVGFLDSLKIQKPELLRLDKPLTLMPLHNKGIEHWCLAIFWVSQSGKVLFAVADSLRTQEEIEMDPVIALLMRRFGIQCIHFCDVRPDLYQINGLRFQNREICFHVETSYAHSFVISSTMSARLLTKYSRRGATGGFGMFVRNI